MKTFVFIESNTTGTGRLCLQKALLRGFDVLFVTSRPQLYPFLQEEMVVPLVADTADPQRIADALAPYAGIAGIFSTSEYYIETAATVATRLGLPAADPRRSAPAATRAGCTAACATRASAWPTPRSCPSARNCATWRTAPRIRAC
ncbi:hypothetical protein AAFM48_16575 [Burkholderia pseudomallei]